ncbi:MAG: hypothetical protein JXR52_07805 [Bacteroidales bacterium]|nr:hypothetical protein [Bacteroidales bacterium]MBN2698714.1 hypothetical protein [Bacteroidales bacterium]
MKQLAAILTTALLLAGCATTTRQMQRGNYDTVINKSVKKLIKNPNSEKYASTMDRAYKLANERDLERIKYLKMENNPDNYDEVMSRYNMLKQRQQQVRTVTPLNINGRSYAYEYIDYDAEIVNSKRKAAEFFYNNGRQLLDHALQKTDYREAYYQLSKASEYAGGQYSNLDNLIYDARMKGISRVVVEVVNQSPVRLPVQVEDDLLAFDTQGLNNSEWIEYHFRRLDEKIEYDYAVLVKLLSIMVGPDETKDTDHVFNKKIDDGFEYVLDANGNVMKDTAGNDIKIRKYRDITCTLIETRQFKAVEIKGEIEIVSLKPERLIKREPFGAQNLFEHFSARAIGDLGALTDEALKKTQQEKVPFPSDVEMVMMCTETIKPAIRNAIYANRQHIR